jgi:hypothetical protein
MQESRGLPLACAPKISDTSTKHLKHLCNNPVTNKIYYTISLVSAAVDQHAKFAFGM